MFFQKNAFPKVVIPKKENVIPKVVIQKKNVIPKVFIRFFINFFTDFPEPRHGRHVII